MTVLRKLAASVKGAVLPLAPTFALLAVLMLSGCLMLLSGCMVGPNYKKSVTPAPPAYSDSGHYGDWTAAVPADAADRGAWWTVYGDTELNDLDQRTATRYETG